MNSNDDLYFRGRKNSSYSASSGGWGEIVSKVDGSGTYSSVKDDFDDPYLFTGPVGSKVVVTSANSFNLFISVSLLSSKALGAFLFREPLS